MQISSRLPDRYIIDSSLGKGGFGEVCKAYDRELNIFVAIKLLTNISASFQSSLIKEFEVLSKLTHPHLVKVYSFGFTAEQIPYFTMEYIEGKDLKAFLSALNSRRHLLHIIDQTLQALGYLHDKEIIHGDIKPENIYISESRNRISVKILDFGLVSTIKDTSTHISGTPRFIAPEVLSKHPHSPTSDLYALGMAFIESLTGTQVPGALEINSHFYKNTQNKLSDLLASNDIPNPSAIASFILNLCEQDFSNRPENAMTALKRFNVIVDISSYDVAHGIDEIFIDRERELELITAFVDRENTDTRILILEGPTGIGKKSLMNKAITFAQPKGYFVLDLSDASFTRNTIERIINTISTNLMPSKREAFLDRHNKILSLIQTRAESERSLTENVRVFYSNMIDYLRAISGDDPILLCIPSIERFSEDFYQFFDQLVHELHLPDSNLLLIISRNTDKPLTKIKSGIFEKSSTLSYLERIHIHPFKDKELEEIQKILFDRILFNKHQIQQIIRDTEGTPLLIVEYIKHLVTNNAIYPKNGIWILDHSSFAEMPIPREITTFIEEEYSRYNRQTKDLLQIMTFWERAIPIDTLSILSGLPNDNINDYVLPLIESMIVERTEYDFYRLTHDAYIKYIKRRTSSGKTKKVNALILDYLEKTASTDYERLADHSISAISINKSMKYVFRAVDLLEQRLEYYKCYELLSKLKILLQKYGQHNQLIMVTDRIAPIELLIGKHDEAINDYKQLFNHTNDNTLKATYSKSIVNIYFMYLGDLRKAMTNLAIATSYANKTSDPCIKAELLLEQSLIEKENREELRQKALSLVKGVNIDLYSKIGSFLIKSYMQGGNYTKAMVLGDELYRMLNEVNPRNRRYIYDGLYNSSFYSGEYAKAKSYTQESINTNTELCDEIGLIANYNGLGGLYYIQGLFYDQINVLKTALNKLMKYNTYDCSFYYGNLSLAYRSVAEYRKAKKALEQATYYYNNLTGEYATEWTLSKYNYYYVLMGDCEKVNYRKYLNKTITTATRTNNSIALGHTKLVNTIYYYQRLLHAYSLRNLTAALTLFRKANDRDDIVDSLRLLTMILIEKCDLDEAKKAVTEARQIFDEIHCDYLKPQLLLAEGALARARNNPDAEAKLKEALKTSKKMFTREYTWQIQRELALHHEDNEELHKALQYYRDAIDMIKQITETIVGDEVKASYLALPFRKRVFDEIKQLKQNIADK